MADLSDAVLEAMSSDTFPIEFQLAFYFCLFGFFGTIISTSVFLKWQQRNLISNNNQSTSQQQQQNKQHNDNIDSNNNCSQMNLDSIPKPPLIPTSSTYSLLPNITHMNHNHMYNNTQIILDWDDTLFPTAYTLLNMKNGKTNSNYIDIEDWTKLNELTDIIYNLLLLYIQLFGANNVCIVTNAKLRWWNESCLMYNKLYTKIHYLLTTIYNIQIISAYDMYNKQKSCAFMDILYNKSNISQVICIGDSDNEYNAIHCVANLLKHSRNINYYRFKLLESPSLNALIKQLDSIQKLDYNLIAQQTYDQSYQFH